MRRGFALVVTLSLMILLSLLAVGLLSLSSLTLRQGALLDYENRARFNARLAMLLALGDLQRHAGPDTRATGPAAILERADSAMPNPHWTGVWNTRTSDGGPLQQRDDAAGGLRDLREAGYDREQAALAWLVSGNDGFTGPDPWENQEEHGALMVGPGTVGTENISGRVRAPRMSVAGGNFAWWAGDLGIRANLATPDPYEEKKPKPENPADGGWFRLMASQEADGAALTGALSLDAPTKRRIGTERTLQLPKMVDRAELRRRYHDFTTQSLGVLSDMAEGGLKRDLTAYFASNGVVEGRYNLPGLADADNLVGPANERAAEEAGLLWKDTRHRSTSPKFGLLRRWATMQAPFSGGSLTATMPRQEPNPKVAASRLMALCNEKPAALSRMDTPGVSPVLVEGSLHFNISRYRKPEGAAYPWDIRIHLYPRIVLWNPYNIPLAMDRCIAMIQGNGRQEMFTEGPLPGNAAFRLRSQWIWFEGGRSSNFNPVDGTILESEGYKDPYMGSFFFSIPRTEFGAGECLVFSPARTWEYNAPGHSEEGAYELDANELSCEVAPHPSRAYCQTNSNINGGISYGPDRFWFDAVSAWAQGGIQYQGDDCRVILKRLGSSKRVTFETFDALPQIAVLSASMQYGAGLEPRIAWNSKNPVLMEETTLTDMTLRQPPDVRTREGIRLRWFDETASNLLGSGALAGTAHFDDALMANWNPRAAYITRSPYENLAGALPAGGSLGGPWFFGAYTRDLYDSAVSWQEQTPVPRGGRYHGNPFGQPQENGGRPIVLFDVPRSPTGVISLAQFQHVKMSEFVWHPSMAVGNSLADPRLAKGPYVGLNRTAPIPGGAEDLRDGGFSVDNIGWSADAQRSPDRASWAAQARAIYQELPRGETLVYDLSYELNHSLWDRYFLSTGNAAAKRDFLADPAGKPLPNGRMRPAPGATEEDLNDFHAAARALMVDGAFNVNSTSVEAWKAMLGSTRSLAEDGKHVPFPRVLNAPGGSWRQGNSTEAQAAWSGQRVLSEKEIGRLAEAIVAEVRSRGPFLSLADFVNRRLANGPTGRTGPLEAAIRAAKINADFDSAYPLDNSRSLPNYKHPDNIRDATALEQTVKPSSKAWGAPGHLTQADVLQVLGPALSARSDTFVIRGYGEATDAAGRVRARAWCEAVAQRSPQPFESDEAGLNPRQDTVAGALGRRFALRSFRWLAADEV